MDMGTSESAVPVHGRPILERQDVQRVLFHPRPDSRFSRVPPGVALVSVPVEPQVVLRGRLHSAGTSAPLILLFHGNGEIAADYDDLAPFYARLGISLLVMDYRGYGASDGTPTATNLLTDARVVFESLQGVLAERGLSPERTFVMGRSLGSAPALEVAVSAASRTQGLVIESGFARTFALLSRLGLSVRGAREESDGFGNLAKAAQIICPTLVIHGQRDSLIPCSEGRALYRQCSATDKRLVIIPNANHNDLLVHGLGLYFEAIRTLIVRP